MRSSRLVLLAAGLVFCLSTSGYAWNKSGHMVAASLAYRELKQSNPERLAALIKILKAHPHFEERWRPILNEVDTIRRDEALFMLAARWPDDMRDPPLKAMFHRRVWHFADHAIKLPGTPDGIPDGVLNSPPEHGDQDEGFPHLLAALPHNLEILRGNASPPIKAIALCWVLHLFGDLHQPLHMSTRFSNLFPDGDKGGNATFVRIPPSHGVLIYHAFWDDLVLRGARKDSLVDNDPEDLADSVTEASQRAAVLAQRTDLSRDNFPQLTENNLNTVAEEGVTLGRRVAYLDGQLTGGADHHDPFLLPAGFSKTAQAVAEKQIAVAGFRLADALK